ncbi:serine protease easter [Stomoxys calcitrans]|uniref:serine protease easter n=1 Tax=Stomoxys calcitrans TaxID=35570 RepID=UPI0027E2CA50|nr:serine protease easter [Stomoxys calcitrans]
MLISLVRSVCVLIGLSVVAKAALLAYQVCTNPHLEKGICIQIKDCAFLYNLLNTSSTNISADNLKLLQGSHCGNDNTQDSPSKQILVCCPERYRFAGNNRTSNSMKSSPAGNVLPAPGECGKILTNRIYGGNVTQIDEFPWMALIQYKTGPDRFGFYCGGGLINSRYVLTAGHCLKHPDMPSTWELYAVRLGEWDLSHDPDCTEDTRGRKECIDSYKDILVDYALAHPSYQAGSKEQFHDIALLRLAESVSPTSYIIPICLPIAENIRSKLFTSEVMDVAGWGITETGNTSPVKLKILVNVWNVTRCQSTYRTFQMNISSEYQLCAGGEDGIDTCRGDSGGPLMVTESINKRHIYYVAGVVSYGPRPCGLEGWPGVYTRVGTYVNWILSNLLA